MSVCRYARGKDTESEGREGRARGFGGQEFCGFRERTVCVPALVGACVQ